ncbi:hypothetical protein [Terriglobus saanensis]|uniref:Glycosyltransferase RgtA/B/C/D-like domain-containing protein n=1 Tax=Terriglobus saanensis (strain ATCC BAA-1853 / DSM 23119 / SP1PR4) TaxID=401053 RepID=E8V6M1_TERSS|nr:hypothetical protein [Terriglobus saanensis]ADV82760.1 hypothetical protein AciPR4_1956 [Terriglobus saanensis SP1PR4]
MLLVVLLYATTFSILISALRVQYGFPLDDSYIHQTVARNFALHHTLGFVIGQRSSGATSLLWEILQASDYKLFGGVAHPVPYNLALSFLFFSIIGSVLYLIARQDGMSWRLAGILAVAPALTGNFMWLGLIGMEHLLFVALSLLAIECWFQDPPSRSGTAIWTGIFTGLAALTRPEAIVLAPLLLLSSYFYKTGRRRKDMLIAGSIWAFMVLIELAANIWTSGSLMPATLKGRSWLYFHTTGGPHSLHSIARYCGAWVQRLPRQFSTHFTEQLATLHQIKSVFAFIGIVLLLLCLTGAYFLLRHRPLPARFSFLLLWAAIHFLTYMFTFPASGHGGRYQPLTLLLFFPLLFVGVYGIFRHGIRLPRQWSIGLVAIIMLVSGIASLRTWYRVTVDGIGHINQVHGEIAAWMNANLPPDARVAAFDIGRISYDWHGQIIDLGGLVDPSYYHFLAEGKVPTYLRLQHAQYVILPDSGIEDMGFAKVHGMQKLLSKCSEHEPWLLGFRYTIHATRCQELYRIP